MNEDSRNISDDIVTVPTTGVVDDLGAVDSELMELYQRAAGTETTGTSIVRALLFNMIVYTRNSAEAEEAALNLAEVSGSRPCRAIIVEDTPIQPNEPPAIVTVICGITSRGDRRLCGEIIRLHIYRSGPRVVGAVYPLLVPDVPVVLWAAGGVPWDEDEFNELVKAADHMMFDSRRFKDLDKELNSIALFCRPDVPSCSVQDLSWASMQLWQELTAQHFDQQVALDYLGKLKRVEVRFSAGERKSMPASAPLLFAGWFIRRVKLIMRGAHVKDSGEYIIETMQNERPVEIMLKQEESDLEPGSIVSVVIMAGDDETGKATFITRAGADREVTVTEECKGVCLPPQVLEMPQQGEAALAAKSLEIYHRDVNYLDALDMARIILSYLKSGR